MKRGIIWAFIGVWVLLAAFVLGQMMHVFLISLPAKLATLGIGFCATMGFCVLWLVWLATGKSTKKQNP